MRTSFSTPQPAPSALRDVLLHLVLLGALCLLGGCATLQPWERGRLAHDCMQVPSDPFDSAFHAHLEAAREGSTGGLLIGGGGCGCN
jgi:hypothetical protein